MICYLLLRLVGSGAGVIVSLGVLRLELGLTYHEWVNLVLLTLTWFLTFAINQCLQWVSIVCIGLC
ncbi:hypothetical protein D3C71_1857320 [compost metagenome]